MLTAVTFAIMAVSFVSTLVLGLLSLRVLPRYHEAAVRLLRERPWVALGVGFVAAALIPVATAILFATILGIPLALILAAAYPIALYWGRIFALHRLERRAAGWSGRAHDRNGSSSSARWSITCSR